VLKLTHFIFWREKMPVIRVDEKGNKKTQWARKVAMVATGVSLAGLVQFLMGSEATGLMLMLGGNCLASIWNLADDS
jgi:hypothetical protein